MPRPRLQGGGQTRPIVGDDDQPFPAPLTNHGIERLRQGKHPRHMRRERQCLPVGGRATRRQQGERRRQAPRHRPIEGWQQDMLVGVYAFRVEPQ